MNLLNGSVTIITVPNRIRFQWASWGVGREFSEAAQTPGGLPQIPTRALGIWSRRAPEFLLTDLIEIIFRRDLTEIITGLSFRPHPPFTSSKEI